MGQGGKAALQGCSTQPNPHPQQPSRAHLLILRIVALLLLLLPLGLPVHLAVQLLLALLRARPRAPRPRVELLI